MAKYEHHDLRLWLVHIHYQVQRLTEDLPLCGKDFPGKQLAQVACLWVKGFQAGTPLTASVVLIFSLCYFHHLEVDWNQSHPLRLKYQ
jgi:hypothetical protein